MGHTISLANCLFLFECEILLLFPERITSTGQDDDPMTDEDSPTNSNSDDEGPKAAKLFFSKIDTLARKTSR